MKSLTNPESVFDRRLKNRFHENRMIEFSFTAPEGDSPAPVPPTVKSPAPAPKKRGRPSSGVSRKEQMRKAVRKHRNRMVRRDLIQAEIASGLYVFLGDTAKQNKVPMRELIEQFLCVGARAYIALNGTSQTSISGMEPEERERFAESIVASWMERAEGQADAAR